MQNNSDPDKKAESRTFMSRINPIMRDIVTNGAKGYMFGSLIGLLNSRRPIRHTFSEMHLSGRRFMMLGMVYTGSEAVLETVRDKKDALNTFGASAIAGGLVMSKSGLGKSMLGAIGFSMYTGLSELYSTRNNK